MGKILICVHIRTVCAYIVYSTEQTNIHTPRRVDSRKDMEYRITKNQFHRNIPNIFTKLAALSRLCSSSHSVHKRNCGYTVPSVPVHISPGYVIPCPN
jgi:hypothetical protein